MQASESGAAYSSVYAAEVHRVADLVISHAWHPSSRWRHADSTPTQMIYARFKTAYRWQLGSYASLMGSQGVPLLTVVLRKRRRC